QHALLDAVALRGALEGIHQRPQRAVESEDGVATVIIRIAEEGIADALFAEFLVCVSAIRHDHVVDALKSIARDARIGAHDVEVILERTVPVLATELFEILTLAHECNDLASIFHGTSSSTGVLRSPDRSKLFPDRQGLGDRRAFTQTSDLLVSC